MKKFTLYFLVIIIIAFQSFLFIGCSDDFKPILKMTIITDGVEKNFSSSRSNSYGEPKSITSDEYDSNRELDENELLKSTLTLLQAYKKIEKGDFSYKYREPKLKGYWFYIAYDPLWTSAQYFKREYSYTVYSFTYAKVVNDTTIKIKTSKGETTYTVSSYTVKWFNL